MRSSANQNAITATNLQKHFGAIAAVNGMDLTVPLGASFGLIGPNGAGKTTFIKLLLGISHPTAGEVTVLGGPPGAIKVRKRIGYLPERLALPPAFTALGFLRSVGRLKGLSSAELDDQVPRTLTNVGLAQEAWDRKTGTFSKGMRQRTGLAAALLGDPELLVLDEPTDGIDPVGRAQIRRVIQEAHKRGTTIFLNSHLLAETEKTCDHVAVVKDGQVVLSGLIASLRAKDAFWVSFAPQEDLDQKAQTHGFRVDPERRSEEVPGAFTFSGHDADELNHALHQCLNDGLRLLELSPQLRDLESVLEQAVTSANGSQSSPSASDPSEPDPPEPDPSEPDPPEPDPPEQQPAAERSISSADISRFMPISAPTPPDTAASGSAPLASTPSAGPGREKVNSTDEEPTA